MSHWLKITPKPPQVAIVGQVVDTETKRPLEGAQVKIVNMTAPENSVLNDKFVARLVTRAKLAALPKKMAEVLFPLLDNPESVGKIKFQAAQIILDYEGLVKTGLGAVPGMMTAIFQEEDKESTGENGNDRGSSGDEEKTDEEEKLEATLKKAESILDAHWQRVGQSDLVRRPDRTRTGADGFFYFADLPAGNYTLVASLPQLGSRYGAGTSKPLEVKTPDEDTLKTTVELPPTTLRGRIIDTDGKPIGMAEVRIQGSGERTFSSGGDESAPENEKGWYRLVGLEAGKVKIGEGKGQRTVLVSAQGYEPANEQPTSEEILLVQGVTKELDFRLKKISQQPSG